MSLPPHSNEMLAQMRQVLETLEVERNACTEALRVQQVQAERIRELEIELGAWKSRAEVQLAAHGETVRELERLRAQSSAGSVSATHWQTETLAADARLVEERRESERLRLALQDAERRVKALEAERSDCGECSIRLLKNAGMHCPNSMSGVHEGLPQDPRVCWKCNETMGVPQT